MAVDTNDVLDLSKENIQPLRQGRKASHLKTALQAQIDPEIQQKLLKEREEFEYMIRMYEGNDPLEPYYNYVIWLEQSFPKTGRENNVTQLLEDTLIKFKDNEKYKQDLRLVQLLIKYLEIQSNPLEIYKLVYDQGLGTMCAPFYKAWAEQYDKVNDIKGADEIFKLGIRCRAQPLDELEKAHVQFQLSVARRMIDGTLNQVAPAESTRTVMSKLKPSKVKSDRISRDGAGVMTTRKTESTLTNLNSQATKFQIYEEDGNHNSQKYSMKKEEKFPKGSVNNRENIMQVGKWCGQKFKKSHKMPPVAPSTPSFPVHEDPEVACSNMKTDFRPRALKIRRDDFNPPIAVFEPPDPTKKPMYPKQLVYLGGRDVQLEEIRAAHYWKNLQQNSCANDGDVIKSANKDEIPATPEIAQLPAKGTEISLTVPQSKSSNWFPPCHHSPSTSMTVNTRAAMKIIQQMWQSPLSEDTRKVDTSFGCMSQESAFPVYSETPIIPQDRGQFPVFCDENDPKSFNAFNVYSDDLATPIEKPGSYSLPSVCVKPKNTKPAFELFCDDDITSNPKPAFEVFRDDEVSSNRKPAFEVFHDDNISSDSKPAFEVFRDDDIASNGKDPVENNFIKINRPTLKTPPFMLRSEDIGDCPLHSFAAASLQKKNENLPPGFRSNISSENQLVKISSKNYCFDDEGGELAQPMGSLQLDNEIRGFKNAMSTPLPMIIPVNLQDTPLEPENKENQAPKDYASPTGRRPLSGILTPAINVPVQELRSDDSDFEEGGSRLCVRHLDMDEETCTTRAFAIPLPTSTPFSRSHESQLKRTSIRDRSLTSDENCQTPSVYMTARREAQELKEMMDNSKKLNFNTPSLSLILENSKELNGFSSGSSGNARSKYITS